VGFDKLAVQKRRRNPLAIREAIVEVTLMKGGRWMLIFWLTVGLLIFGRAAAGALPDYELQGKITRTMGTGNTSNWCDFSIAVSGPKSLISVLYFNGEYFVCGTDGEDSYLLNEMRPARARDPETSQVGGITSGPLSAQASAPVQLTWIAYASSAYLADHKQATFPLESFQEKNGVISNKIIRFADSGRLPQMIEWSYPGRNLAARYTSEQTTNFLGTTIPVSWRFDFYGPDGRVFDVLRGTITNLSPRSYVGTFLPKLEGAFRLTEWRLEPEIGMAFDVSDVDGEWPQKDDPELQRMWKIYRASYNQSKRGQALRYKWGFILAGGLFVVLIISGDVYLLRRNDCAPPRLP